MAHAEAQCADRGQRLTPMRRQVLEALAAAIVDRNAEQIRGQQIARELDALEAQTERSCEGVCERRFADTRHVFDEKMPACEQTRKGKPDLRFFPENDAADLPEDTIDLFAHVGSVP